MLSKKDLSILKDTFVTKKEFGAFKNEVREDFIRLRQRINEDVKEELKNYLTKDDFYTRFDILMGELKSMREEIAAMFYRQQEHTTQLEEQQVLLTHHSVSISQLQQA